jgi:hypothetical protein
MGYVVCDMGYVVCDMWELVKSIESSVKKRIGVGAIHELPL